MFGNLKWLPQALQWCRFYVKKHLYNREIKWINPNFIWFYLLFADLLQCLPTLVLKGQCPACFRCFPESAHLWSLSIIIWIRCFKAEKPLKHAGQCALRVKGWESYYLYDIEVSDPQDRWFHPDKPPFTTSLKKHSWKKVMHFLLLPLFNRFWWKKEHITRTFGQIYFL